MAPVIIAILLCIRVTKIVEFCFYAALIIEATPKPNVARPDPVRFGTRGPETIAYEFAVMGATEKDVDGCPAFLISHICQNAASRWPV